VVCCVGFGLCFGYAGFHGCGCFLGVRAYRLFSLSLMGNAYFVDAQENIAPKALSKGAVG
jgi:hypothetical protein